MLAKTFRINVPMVAGFELTVCNVQFAHRFAPNSENCISVFKTICKFLLPSVKAYNPTVAIDWWYG